MADETLAAKNLDSKLLLAMRRSAAASLAGGMIAASGRAHTADEALVVFREVYKAMGGQLKKGRQPAR